MSETIQNYVGAGGSIPAAGTNDRSWIRRPERRSIDEVRIRPDVDDELRERLVEGVEEMTVGVGLEEDIDVGSVITPEAQERVNDLIDEVVEESAELMLDKRDFKHSEYIDGNFI